jgi:chemotaxis protein histidine kinase CheA
VTTADEVSDMSGRGVGLDAVAAAVGALGGHVDLTTASGRGTTFTVTLPTTLVVASVFLVQTRGAVYAIDVNQVSEVGVLAPGGVMLGADGPSVEWRGERIPFYRLAALTRATGEVWEPSSALPCVVAHIGDQLAAVAVDGLVGEREVVLKPLGRHARMLVGVSGAVELDGGRIALLVDLQTLAAERRRASAAGAQEA